MKETVNNSETYELEGQMHFYDDNGSDVAPTTEQNNVSVPESNDELKAAIETQLTKIRRQSMLIGAQTSCSVILEKIMVAMSKPGKRTMNDYKRLVKDIEQFCQTGVSRKINADGEAEVVEQDNTKLMEESDEGNTNESN